MTSVAGILRVAIAAPVSTPFDYSAPVGLDGPTPRPGQRVLVPFGRGRRVGIIIAMPTASPVPAERLKPVMAILDDEPLLTENDLGFLLWAADYYRYPLGEALFSALPTRLRRAVPTGSGGRQGWRLTSQGRAGCPETLARAPKQAQVWERLRGGSGAVPSSELTADLGDCSAALRALARRGWVEPCRIAPCAVAGERSLADHGPVLNPEQRAAVEQVRAAFGRFQPFLLDGVTASGKTEVYIRLLDDLLAAGGQALVLVPEIGLTPQLGRRLAARLNAALVVLHSGLPDAEREEGWRRAVRGEAGVLLGTRSAVLVPLPRLGLVIVDEEHDLSFKQQEGFRYSGRDLAVRRAQLAGCPIVLGSATPSLETLANVRSGRYRRLPLAQRAGGAGSPTVGLVDIRAQALQAGLSPRLLECIERELTADNQVLLFLNRRGFAPLLTCHDCGWISGCPRCDARLTLHRSSHQLRCHHCGLVRVPPVRCPHCGGPDLRALGQGTERIEEMLSRRFPGLPVARVDRDSTRRRGDLTDLLNAARRGEFRILLGTQMLTKGHHFPGVTLVGVLDADSGLFGTDYRAPERMAQLLIQVMGRAGRAERPGHVLIQTRHPDHPFLRVLLRDGYPAFAEAALAERRTAALPPFSHQVLIRAEASEAALAYDFLRAAARAAAVPFRDQVVLWGPASAPMERRAGRWRAQLLVQSPRRASLRGFLDHWIPVLKGLPTPARVRWAIDVDPQDMT
ncbi:primosomal protein N' [Thioalkalicoccus limnaeus]|uniref:Replication restart protein PriA n=1 Tax=Thioalkalicoccus limnaeus TaxID=120681 RepID=A0ABV4BAL7_9GAMM